MLGREVSPSFFGFATQSGSSAGGEGEAGTPLESRGWKRAPAHVVSFGPAAPSAMGRSGKLRSGCAGKLKRWRKGHSSDSNPEGRRYRSAARGRLLAPRSENSNLTVDALKLHNELQSSGPLPSLGDGKEAQTSMEEDDNAGTAKTHKSTATFLSGLSDCTNLTFSKVQRLWESNSAAHKEICALLAAVTEVIRSKGGVESETEYFGALMTTLEAVESPESMAAVAYLLNLVLKRVPGPVLIKKFSDTSKAFMGIISSQTSTSTLRWMLSCLATLLRRQNLVAWNYPVTMQTFHGLLSFTVHVKPKVRKTAQHGVCSILRGSEFLFGDGAPSHHPAASSTAKFCVQEIEKAGGAKESTTTLHVLTLLRDLLACLPAPSVKSCCETLLRVMTLSHVLVTACAMKAFHSLFAAQPPASCLPVELNAQIIVALYDYVPNESDLQPLLAWLSVMERAHVNLAKLKWELCWAHLPRLFSGAMNAFLSPHTQVVSAAAQTLKVLLGDCVAPHFAEVGKVSSAAPSGPTSHVCKMFRAVEEGLTYRFHAAWAFVLEVLRAFLEACGQQCHSVMRKCLQSLADLRSSPHFPHTVLLDQALGTAVANMGPELVLEAVPLNIDGTEEILDFPRSWLLPVLRDHIQNAPLAFFSSYFLPLAATLKNRATELANEGRDLEAKIYDTLQWQIWTLLPAFCTHPTDVVTSFKGLARTLGTAISNHSDLRLIVCQALRRLINKGCQTEAERAEVGRFAKNFLPILFNAYSQESSASPVHRRSVLDTVRAYLTITESEMVCTFVEKASEKLTNTENSDFTRLSILDLIITMAPYVDEASLNVLYSSVQPTLQNKDHRMQKKAYRLLEEVCASEKPPCRNFVRSHLEGLQKDLLGSLPTATSPAKRPRLKCLFHIVKQLTAEQEDFVAALVPEVILCTKEVSVGARKNAYNLLVEMGHAFLRFGPTPKDGMQRYLFLVYAGLTSSVTVISCTVLALSRLLFEFKDHIGTDALGQLMQHVCLMVGSRTRDVVKSALGFLKVALLLLDAASLGRHMETVLEAVGGLTEDMRRHFRMKLRNLLSKLMRKFGFEPLKALLPESYHKVLLNVRKAEARNRKRQALKQAVATSAEEEGTSVLQPKGDSMEELLADSDSDMEDDIKQRRGRATKKAQRQCNQAWLKEGESDEPLNFLDPNVSQRVLATKPGTGLAGKVSHDFKVSADGRLIICEEEEEEEEGTKDVDEEMADLMQEVGIRGKKAQKRRFREEVEEEVEEPGTGTQPQYKAGGTGIHRPVGKNAAPGLEYKAKKGKGDIKKKGRLDPYAYIPLNRAKLNRRKKAKLQGQYKGLMRGAQRGAQAGRRHHKKQPHV